ncbi:universal stress protein [Enterococcus saccharolyticus]|uniref:universal stress protein n=1 Tax=Enterococcus TaxID=1350 RepID=UPI001E57745F|nr:universal stress protein [Enterococcus saccharolyticus]MCD5001742.1 universal stress protein [Enterococcus saccharolyticus]
MHQHILAVVDGSNMTETVIQRAVDEALIKHARLTILRVLETPHYLWHVPNMKKIMAHTKKFVEEEMAEIETMVSGKLPDERLESFVISGNPKRRIISYAQTHETIDLIIAGATGETEEILTGSTATYIINHALCDVLIVR